MMRSGTHHLFLCCAAFACPLVALGGPAYLPWSGGLPAGNRGLGQDPDLDGRPNGLEFVTGSDAAMADPGEALRCGHEAVGTDRFATLTFRLVAPSFADVSVVVQASGDLVTWTALATLPPLPSASWTGPGAVETRPWPDESTGPGIIVTARDVVPLLPEAPRFLRLAVLPVQEDTDGDGLPDAWELLYGLNPDVSDAHLDLDGDGLSNEDEFLHGSRPDRRDTDADGRSDGFEVADGTNPAVADGDAWAGSRRHPATGLLVHLPAK